MSHPEIFDSFDLLIRLKGLGYDDISRDPWWWPASGSYETVVGAILTQNTSWSNVERSLRALEGAGLLSPDKMARVRTRRLEELIRSSGFYRAKARNLKELSRAIVEEYGKFEEFREQVDREWLLRRRGIGPESADAILNYACYKKAFVVDSYTARLLESLGYRLESYDAIQEWLIEGLEGRTRELFPDSSPARCYARSHGMIVEYCKRNKKGRRIDPFPLGLG